MSVSSITAKNIKIRELDFGSTNKLQLGKVFVFSALVADSVDITITCKKDKNFNYSKFVSTVLDAITTSKVVSKLQSIIDTVGTVTSRNSDSISYRMTLRNPDLCYKVKLIRYKGLNKHNWSKYGKSFYNENYQPDGYKNNFTPEFFFCSTPMLKT